MSCILPFINLEARTDGTMAVCCIMQESAKKDDGTEFNLANGDTLSDVKNSKWLKDTQQKFLKDEKLEACNNCWHEEKAGIQSKRLRENFYWGEDFTPDTKALDLKLGNICNSKCRICSSFASSQWAAEEIKINPNNEGAKKFNKLGMWPKTNEHFWKDIDTHLQNIEKLEFFGGEPLMIERHYEILQRCIELGIAKNISLSYNTNGSIFPEDKIQLWEQFKKVEIFLSIDDINERFEYIRFPGNFTEVITNLGHFSKLNKNIFSIGIFQTISIFNIMHMAELTKLPSNINWNYLGQLKSNQVNNTFLEYDMFFFPTLGENFGYVILESLSNFCSPLLSKGTTIFDDLDKYKIGSNLNLNTKPSKWVNYIENFNSAKEDQDLLKFKNYLYNKFNIAKIIQSNNNLINEVLKQ